MARGGGRKEEMMKRWRSVVAGAALAAILVIPNVARAEEYPENAGWGVLAVVANIGYMPVKTVYAVIGGLTGGFAYACTGGNYETASNIWSMSLGGTYVLSPAMIRGEEPIYFAGGPSDDRAVSDVSAPDTQSSRSRREEGLPSS
jgi:hypothetical protein